MFGRKRRARANRLPIEAGAFMTLAQATAAACADHSDPMGATKYFGNIVLGTMAAYGLGPQDGPDESAVWELIWINFGGPLLGDSWQVLGGFDLDTDGAVQFAQLLAPLMNTPRGEVQRVATEVLAPVFGKRHSSELELTESLPCVIAGVSLRTMLEDALDEPADRADDRVSIGALVVACYLQIAAKADTLQERLQGDRVFRVTVTPLHLNLVNDAGPGTLRVSSSGSARFISDSGTPWDLGDLAASVSDYTMKPNGDLSGGFKPPMSLMLHADGDDALRLDQALRTFGLSPKDS